MKRFFVSLLIFVLFVAAGAAINVWPVQHFLASGGSLDPEFTYPDPLPPELAQALAYFASSALAGVILVIFGLAWSFLKAWKPFAIALGLGAVINGSLLAFSLYVTSKDIEGWQWIPWLFALTVPAGFVALIYSLFLSLKNNLILVTLYRLTSATALAALITLLFPFIVVAAGLYLKFKRGLKFSEVWSESPHLYNFLMVNLYPIFFHILPGFGYVLSKGREEKKLAKKNPVPAYQCRMDLDKLKVGDVILTGTNSWNVAVPIQASNILSNSEGDEDRPWCHAAIYAGEGKLIEAQSDGRGVTETDIASYFFPKGTMLRVFRHNYVSENDLQTAVAFCRDKQQKGCAYDTWGVSFYGLAALIPPMLSGWLESPFAERFFNVNDAYFCSELVADGFKAAGHDIFKRKSWRVKPLDFAYTPVFREVTKECNYQRWPVIRPGIPAPAAA